MYDYRVLKIYLPAVLGIPDKTKVTTNKHTGIVLQILPVYKSKSSAPLIGFIMKLMVVLYGV
jgi:hypothetical protein